ncbi:mtACP-1 [Phakopsora pachyrhizi]|nr:mtACP-1 [Phakopsora pachyrhizi]
MSLNLIQRSSSSSIRSGLLNSTAWCIVDESLKTFKSSNQNQQVRFGSSGALTRDSIQNRILEVLGNFEKCEPTKITPTASFTADLGLDSLDAVEVVMAIEEEFSIEIPDEEADKITTVSEAIAYIERTPEAI